MKLDLHSDQRLKLAKEMYLKAILQLSQKQEVVKQSDLVLTLDVGKSSVNEMVSKLKSEGLLNDETNVSLILTPKGRKLANIVFKKYTIIKDFLEQKLNLENAHDEACQLEHAFSLEATEKLEEFLLNNK